MNFSMIKARIEEDREHVDRRRKARHLVEIGAKVRELGIEGFEAIYPELARRNGAALYPFFMEGVAGQKGMTQPDGMHPTFEGVKRIVTGITPAVKQALGR